MQRAAARGLQAGASGRQKDGLSADEQKQVGRLKEIDRKVRAHEQAHVAAGGGLVQGGVNFSYETGPDQKRYAVAGDVSIDVSEGKTPAETLAKAQQVREAALAPADPSPQDRRVAAEASQMEMRARREMAARSAGEPEPSGNPQSSRAIGAYLAMSGVARSMGFSASA